MSGVIDQCFYHQAKRNEPNQYNVLYFHSIDFFCVGENIVLFEFVSQNAQEQIKALYEYRNSEELAHLCIMITAVFI